MSELTFVMDGKPTPIRSDEDIEALYAFLKGYARFAWGMNKATSLAVNTSPQAIGSATAGETVLSKSVEKDESRATQTGPRSWQERAWHSIGQPATSEQIYKAALKMGFRSRAVKPLTSFKRAIRENSHFKSIGTDSNGANLWIVEQSANDNEQIQHDYSTQAKPASEYAHEVLKEAGKALTNEEIADRMKAKGWSTLSDTPEKRAKSAHSALFRSKGMFYYHQGKWDLVERKGDNQHPLDELTLDEDTSPF